MKGGPVLLARLDVGGDGVLESPEADQRVWGQRGEEFVQLGIGFLTPAARVDPELGTDLIGVDSDEGVGPPVESQMAIGVPRSRRLEPLDRSWWSSSRQGSGRSVGLGVAPWSVAPSLGGSGRRRNGGRGHGRRRSDGHRTGRRRTVALRVAECVHCAVRRQHPIATSRWPRSHRGGRS